MLHKHRVSEGWSRKATQRRRQGRSWPQGNRQILGLQGQWAELEYSQARRTIEHLLPRGWGEDRQTSGCIGSKIKTVKLYPTGLELM